MIQDMTGMFTKFQTQSKLFINGRLEKTKKGVVLNPGLPNPGFTDD